MVARALRLRPLWGILPGDDLAVWRKRFPEWKKQGYDGIETALVSLSDRELDALRSLCDQLGFEISVTIFTSWPRYIGIRPSGLVPDVHLKTYREQVQRALLVKPVRINAQSGADCWSWDDSVYFYSKTLEIDVELDVVGLVCHETHRNRALFNPYVADYVLQRVPKLKITGDFSHWVLCAERLLICEEDQEILRRTIPHVYHIHTRMSTTQASQCPEPTNPVFQAEREFFEKLWLDVIDSRLREDTNAVITWVPEYGPFPYHPYNAAKTFDELGDNEGRRLSALFGDRISRAN